MEANSVTESLRRVFMAGVGAVAAVGEKGGEVVESLAERGESVVKQGRDLNRELTQKGAAAVGGVREDVLRGVLSVMAPADRAQFLEEARRIAAELDERDAAKAAQQTSPGAVAVTVPVTGGDAPVEPEPASDEPAACGCACAQSAPGEPSGPCEPAARA